MFDGDNVSDTVWFTSKVMDSSEVLVLSLVTFTEQESIANSKSVDSPLVEVETIAVENSSSRTRCQLVNGQCGWHWSCRDTGSSPWQIELVLLF